MATAQALLAGPDLLILDNADVFPKTESGRRNAAAPSQRPAPCFDQPACHEGVLSCATVWCPRPAGTSSPAAVRISRTRASARSPSLS